MRTGPLELMSAYNDGVFHCRILHLGEAATFDSVPLAVPYLSDSPGTPISDSLHGQMAANVRGHDDCSVIGLTVIGLTGDFGLVRLV
jgi:hypothetical protein